MKVGTPKPKIYGSQKIAILKGKFRAHRLPQETRKISNKQSNLTSKVSRKE